MAWSGCSGNGSPLSSNSNDKAFFRKSRLATPFGVNYWQHFHLHGRSAPDQVVLFWKAAETDIW